MPRPFIRKGEDSMLPFSYNKDRCRMYPVNPGTLYAYWDYSSDTWQRLERIGAELAVYLVPDKGPEERHLMSREIKSYYFKGLREATPYRLRIMARGDQGEEFLLESSIVATPAGHPSEDSTVVYASLRIDEPLPESESKSGKDFEEETIHDSRYYFEAFLKGTQKGKTVGSPEPAAMISEHFSHVTFKPEAEPLHLPSSFDLAKKSNHRDR